MPGDRRKLLVDDDIADRGNAAAHDGLALRTTMVRETSATWTPFWL
ncbi:hypothetical protein Ga0466249_005463, partial [Sporomusaceae bacterium BoRhaA]|nr:hypothetical protein [Pelorhabdus rhamnosifermentans]